MTPGAAPFVARHVGPSAAEQSRMLDALGLTSLEGLVEQALPASIRPDEPLGLPAGRSESEVLAELAEIASRNEVLTSMIGQGYSATVTPPVIVRNILESPAWYTGYTPYQSEISQGRLEALIIFQTMVADLTGLPVANASLLDEATAAAEAMTLCRRSSRSRSRTFLVDSDVHPQTLAVLSTRAEPLGIELLSVDLAQRLGVPDGGAFGLLVQYPGTSGRLLPLGPLVEQAHAVATMVAVAADILALTVLTPPGDAGADVAVGSTQRFGVPMGYGGPHAAYLAVRHGLERSMPGRLVGASVDAAGHPAYRLALQTREQHIRREKATSNICTAQVLLAVIAAMYAVYHGPEGLTAIAHRAHRLASLLAGGLREGGVHPLHDQFFDTVRVPVPGRADQVVAAALSRGVNLRRVDADTVSASTDETTTVEHLHAVWSACGVEVADLGALASRTPEAVPEQLARTSEFLTHPVFSEHRSETALLRYLRRLSDRDLTLDRTMIPLGSCTMKLNGTAEMMAISWPAFAAMHPFAPAEQAEGFRELTTQLEGWLAEITGYDAVSLQPNAGSQGELGGLLAVRGYHRANGQEQRDVCLVPSSAHGTNAASAVLAGLRVVVVGCTPSGDVDLVDLAEKIGEHGERLACLMITYPSTHGVYEEAVTDLCAAVHEAGGQVYVDGANLNALVGLARPGRFGADVSHLNLHKTFCIPHGGGGPGVGPVAVLSHLAPFLPRDGRAERGGGAVCAAPLGSASILPISWAYVRLMGGVGLKRASSVAVLSANYLAARLDGAFPVLYRGARGRVAHECILDLRPMTKATGVTVDDVAKRLIDFGFHAPTVSFPVAGTLMVEPTESEDLGELDRFCEAMLAIRAEIDAVAAGTWPDDDNPLRNAPHTAEDLLGDWSHPYSRAQAVNPTGHRLADKYWPPVKRVDNGYGDRHLVCSCPSPEAFAAGDETLDG